jgi:hypothetical protein
LDKVDVFKHAGELDDALQLEFAPTAGGRGGTQRAREFGGLGLERSLGGREAFELFGERAVGGGAGLLDFGDLAVDFFEGIAERFDEGVDGELAFLEVAGRLSLELGEGLLGLREKIGAVGAEGVGGEGFEFGDEALVRGFLRGELGGVLGDERRESMRLGALRGKFLGEPRVFVGEGAGALGERGGAAAPIKPDDQRANSSGEEGDKKKRQGEKSGESRGAERAGEQAIERGFVARGGRADANDESRRTEFVDDLAASAAGARGLGGRRENGDGKNAALTGRGGGENRGALGAIAQTVGGVLDVAAGVDFARGGEDGGAHGKLGIRRIRFFRGGAGDFFELAANAGGNVFSHGEKYQRPSSVLVVAKALMADSRSAREWAALTWVRMRAAPWGTTG